jgi:hypothetical protein
MVAVNFRKLNAGTKILKTSLGKLLNRKKMVMKDKNGNELRGAALQSALIKKNGWQPDEVEICVSGIFDRLSQVERHQQRLPLLMIGAIAVGCTFGTILKPNLAAIAIGAGAAGVGVSLVRK